MRCSSHRPPFFVFYYSPLLEKGMFIYYCMGVRCNGNTARTRFTGK